MSGVVAAETVGRTGKAAKHLRSESDGLIGGGAKLA
jgi:hypothetical protein